MHSFTGSLDNGMYGQLQRKLLKIAGEINYQYAPYPLEASV